MKPPLVTLTIRLSKLGGDTHPSMGSLSKMAQVFPEQEGTQVGVPLTDQTPLVHKNVAVPVNAGFVLVTGEEVLPLATPLTVPKHFVSHG
jgi:hypothetical protein